MKINIGVIGVIGIILIGVEFPLSRCRLRIGIVGSHESSIIVGLPRLGSAREEDLMMIAVDVGVALCPLVAAVVVVVLVIVVVIVIAVSVLITNRMDIVNCSSLFRKSVTC